MSDTFTVIGLVGIPLWIWFSYSQGFWGSLVGFASSLAILTILGIALSNSQYTTTPLFEFIIVSLAVGVIWGGAVFVGVAVLRAILSGSPDASGGSTSGGIYAYECRPCGWYQERSQRKTIWNCPGCGRRGGIVPKKL